VLSPCPINYGRRNKLKSLDMLKLFADKTIIKNNADPAELAIDFKKGIVLGKFVDVDKPTPEENYEKICMMREG
jgi:2-oxoglutarate ferredoxin oxidoreductase subunit beta